MGSEIKDEPKMLSDFGFLVAVIACGIALIAVRFIAGRAWEQLM